MNTLRQDLKTAPLQVKIPLLVAILIGVSLLIYNMNHSVFSGETLSMLIFYLGPITQFVCIKWACKKIPFHKILICLAIVFSIFAALHHEAETNPLLFMFIDFIILEVICVAFGINWRKEYYPEQDKDYEHTHISNFVKKTLDVVTISLEKLKKFKFKF